MDVVEPPHVPVIASPREITVDWLSQVLAANGIDARVGSFTTQAVGTGQLGETCRISLVYAGTAAPAAPQTLVAKFPSADETSARSGRELGIYRTEVMFYRELAGGCAIRTPRAYAAEIDDAGRFVLLFEDLAPARQGDQLNGCDVGAARQVLREAVHLHAAFWNDAALRQRSWVSVPRASQGFYTTELIERSWDHVKKNYAEHLSAGIRDVCERFVRNHAHWNRPRSGPVCFSHNDFRLDNMLFGGPDGRVAVVDWQTASVLGAGMDVAYFLGSALDPETRKTHEQSLLREYHGGLVERGVTGYPFDQLWRDYAHYTFAGIAVAIAATLIVRRTERGDRMLMQMTRSAAQHALDTGALDELPA